MSTFFCPIPSHSCDPLEDLLHSLSQYGSVSALPDDEDLEFDDSTSGFTLIIGEFLCFSCQLSSIGWQTVEFSPCSTSAYPYSHGLDCTGSLGFCMKTLVLHLWTKLRKTMFHFLYPASRSFEDSSLLSCGFDPPLYIRGFYPYSMMYSHIVKELVFQ